MITKSRPVKSTWPRCRRVTADALGVERARVRRRRPRPLAPRSGSARARARGRRATELGPQQPRVAREVPHRLVDERWSMRRHRLRGERGVIVGGERAVAPRRRAAEQLGGVWKLPTSAPIGVGISASAAIRSPGGRRATARPADPLGEDLLVEHPRPSSVYSHASPSLSTSSCTTASVAGLTRPGGTPGSRHRRRVREAPRSPKEDARARRPGSHRPRPGGTAS